MHEEDWAHVAFVCLNVTGPHTMHRKCYYFHIDSLSCLSCGQAPFYRVSRGAVESMAVTLLVIMHLVTILLCKYNAYV